jgi:predicted O-linked N-acetylglucosamine transferase (SPINDLY family)
MERARVAEADGDAALALEHLEQVFRVDTGHVVEGDGMTPERKTLFARAAVAAAIGLIAENRWEDAESALHTATRLLPGWSAPYDNLAYLEMRRANVGAAMAHYQTAITLDPGAVLPRSYLLFAMDLCDDVDPQANYLEHRRFGEWLAGVTPRTFRSHCNSPDPDRPLRVGYVSSDFRIHPVAQFLEPLLGDHDPSQVTFLCYSNTKLRDELTADFERRFAHAWRDIVTLTDNEVADLVRSDEIDILVDLSGHTADSRLGVFAQKPAPLQVAWLGYLNTTGLPTMDYRLVDRHTDPVGVTDAWSTERLVRLPESQWAYWPVIEMPLLPRKKAGVPGRVVLGSQNQYAKLSDRCLGLWGQIMSRLPEARLRVAGVPPGSGARDLLVRLERFGIPGERVETVPRVPIKQYLEAFNQIDIALDSMPYNGATTALDTLWMGVPVVGLVGVRPISRGTYSILKTLGRDDLVAGAPEEYVDLNVRLATDVEWRNELHRSLREQLRRSPLMDISRFAESLESAYRGIWGEWCELQAT